MESLDNSNNKNVSLSLIAEYGGSDSDSDDTETRSNDNTGADDSDGPLSEMVLKNNIINACAHGPLSRDREEAEVTRHMIIDSVDSGVVEYEVTEYRDVESDDSSSSESSSDVESVKDIEEISSGDEFEVSRNAKPETPKVNGELGLDDLPPIEDLAISMPEQETTTIGTIASVVDRLVIVRAFPGTSAVDLDSVLFLENGAKTLGKVFDVFGPVSEPHYCVRFNSAEHVRARGAVPGQPVCIAPRSQHTSYVFLSELIKLKGSDASWLNDVEPPPHQVDYSDDEDERRARREARQEARQRRAGDSPPPPAGPPPPPPPRPAHTRRGRNPFAARRNQTPRFTKPWSGYEVRTPPHPSDPGGFAPPNFQTGPMYPPPFNPSTPPPPFMNMFQFGGSPRMPNSMHHPSMGAPPYRHVFGSNYCGPQPQWLNNGPPPPPGT